MAIPLLRGLRARRGRALCWYIVVSAASWLPFVIADHGTLAPTGRHFAVLPGTTLWLVGLHGLAPVLADQAAHPIPQVLAAGRTATLVVLAVSYLLGVNSGRPRDEE